MHSLQIAPSILAANPLSLGAEARRMLDAGADLLHVDIMDGHFVPNLTYGPALVKALRRGFPHTALDVHLMLDTPADFIGRFIDAGSDEVTIHVEAAGDLAALLFGIRARGCRAGLSLRPGTDAAALQPYLDLCDLVLVMTVEPGFGGQKLIPAAADKLARLRAAGYAGTLSADGGITPDNAALLRQQGATRLVMGTALFSSPDPARAIAACHAL